MVNNLDMAKPRYNEPLALRYVEVPLYKYELLRWSLFSSPFYSYKIYNTRF